MWDLAWGWGCEVRVGVLECGMGFRVEAGDARSSHGSVGVGYAMASTHPILHWGCRGHPCVQESLSAVLSPCR